MDSHMHVPFVVKLLLFKSPDLQTGRSLKSHTLEQFGLRKFLFDFAFPEREHPLFFIGTNESYIVNRQSGCEKLKYVVKFHIGVHIT